MGRGLNALIGLTNAAAKSTKKNAQKRERAERQYEKEQRQLEKEILVDSNYDEFTEHVDYLESITTLHKKPVESTNWILIKNAAIPESPIQRTKNETIAKKYYNEYHPTFLDKLLKRSEKKKLILSEKIKVAINEDREEYEEELRQYKEDYKKWKIGSEIASKILDGKTDIYKKAIEFFAVFSELNSLKCIYSFSSLNKVPELLLYFSSKKIIPKETKTILKGGKLTIKEMPNTKYHEYCRDFICSTVLYAAKKTFALLPIKELIISAKDDSDISGKTEENTIIFLKLERENILEIDFITVIPFEAISNFEHKMEFKKKSGFEKIQDVN